MFPRFVDRQRIRNQRVELKDENERAKETYEQTGERERDRERERVNEETKGARTIRIRIRRRRRAHERCDRGKRGHILRRDATRRDAKRSEAAHNVAAFSARTIRKTRYFHCYTLHCIAGYAFGNFVLWNAGAAGGKHVSRCRHRHHRNEKPLLFFFVSSFPQNPYPALS